MPTVIDELIVRLRLDGSLFFKGGKDTSATLVGIRSEADKTGKIIEQRNKQAIDSVSRLRNQVIGLFAAFTAGRSLKEFVSDMTESSAAVGRMAVVLDISAQRLSSWQGVARLTGGSADGITGTLATLESQMQQFVLTGESSTIPYLRALGIGLQDTNGQFKTSDQLLRDLAGSTVLHNLDPARANAVLRALGIDQNTSSLILRTDGAMNKLLDDQKRLGVVTEDQSRAAQRLQLSWGQLMQSAITLGRNILTSVTPSLVRMLDGVTRIAVWAQSHPKLIATAFAVITAAVVTLTTAITAGLVGIAFTSIVEGIAAISTALLATPVGWLLAGIAAIIAIGYEFYQHWDEIASNWGEAWESVSTSLSAAFSNIKSAFIDLINTAAQFFGYVGEGAWADFGNIVIATALLALTEVANILNLIADSINLIVDLVHGKWSDAWKQAGTTAKDAIRTLVPGGTSLVGSRESSAPSSGGNQSDSDIAFFQSRGWTKEQAKGIVANVQRESKGSPSASGDGGDAYGLGQWHRDRQNDFRNFAGVDIRNSTRGQQLAFIDFELRNKEKRAGDALRGTTTSSQAAAVVSRLYERPANGAIEASTRSAIAAALGGDPSTGTPSLSPAWASALGVSSNDNRRSSTNTSEVNVGSITINSQATDAQGIAKDIKPAMERSSLIAHANYGQQG